MICFGSLTFFSYNSDECQNCELMPECALACDALLKRLGETNDLASQIKKHQAVLKKLGLVEKKKRSKKTMPPPSADNSNIETAIIDELYARGAIIDGKINWTTSPQWLTLVSNSIEMYGEISSIELVKSVKLKVPEGLAVSYCSKAVIALNKLGYISVENKRSKQIIKWLS